MRFRIFVSLLSVAVSSLLVVSNAQADTDLGQLGTNHSCGGSGYSEIQYSTGGPPRYEVPTAGVINSWSVQATAQTDTVVRLKMFRPTMNPDQFKLIGESSNQGPLTPNALNGPFPASIPVQAGDLLGIFVAEGSGYGCLFDTADAGDTAKEVLPDNSVVGDTVTTASVFNPTRVNVAATLGPPAAPVTPVTPVTPKKKKCKKHKKHRSAESAKKKKCKKKKHG